MMRRLGRCLSSVPPTHRERSGTSATQSPFGVGASAASHVASSSSSCEGSMRFCSSAAMRTVWGVAPPISFSGEEYLKRTGRDSNPRYPYGHAGFRDRSLQPLGHLSKLLDG